MSLIKNSKSGQNIEYRGGATFLQGLGLPKSTELSAPLFATSGTQIRYNEDVTGIQFWNVGNDSWVTLASLDDINDGTFNVPSYSIMQSIVTLAIATESQKPLMFLVQNDESRDQVNTTYNFYPDLLVPANGQLKYIPSEDDIVKRSWVYNENVTFGNGSDNDYIIPIPFFSSTYSFFIQPISSTAITAFRNQLSEIVMSEAQEGLIISFDNPIPSGLYSIIAIRLT